MINKCLVRMPILAVLLCSTISLALAAPKKSVPKAVAKKSVAKPAPAPVPSPTPVPAPIPPPSATDVSTTNDGLKDTVLPVGPAEPPFMEIYPHLKNYLYKEPSPGLYFGVGATPVGMVKDTMMFSVGFFQLHYISAPWDIEILNATYGFTRTGDPMLQSDHFTFRVGAKYQFSKLISAGGLFGYELVSFQKIDAKLYKAPWVTRDWEPFSTRGLIYGAIMSETWPYKKSYLFRISQVFYKQTYSVKEAGRGWNYLYRNNAVQTDRSGIEAGYVAAVEFSILY